ncbi:MAG: Maf family protein [Anaerolineales bacterium]|nr:Maf family protein [Anaerolineales bacterium]
MPHKPVLVLASNSPRRSSLLGLGGWMFYVRPVQIDESPRANETPREYVLRLAESKARACAQTARPGEIILGADTTVTLGETILGKPADLAEAFAMLKQLRGKTHQVYTAIAILDTKTNTMVTDVCLTNVPMRNYSDEEIRLYVMSGDPLDKAGAYAIQNESFKPVPELTGCLASVIGLPLCHLSRSLKKLDISSRVNIAAQCQSELKYTCPISARVLAGEEIG